jgi:hypothetical protein
MVRETETTIVRAEVSKTSSGGNSRSPSEATGGTQGSG